MTKIIESKLLTFLLCFVMIATAFGQVPAVASAAENDSSQLAIQMDGENVNEAELTRETNAELTVTGAGDKDVQWQYYAAEYKMWINIYGETADKCILTYAKVCNMLDDNDKTVIRCIQKDGDKTIKSNEVDVIVSEATNNDADAPATSTFALRKSAAQSKVSNYDVEPQAEGDSQTPATYNVVINYNFENGTIAADPYTANLAAGSSFSATVTFPTVQGYMPYLNEKQQNSIELNYSAVNQDDTYNVVYKPTNVNYTVIHYQQNVNDDKYTESERETKQGLTNSTVPEVAKEYAGFYALLYEKPAIAADGSTVVEVYYDRYYYLMNFDLDGGYGVEPIYARYGTPIGNVGTPKKAGYSFAGWSLDGTNIEDLPETMPGKNRIYKAVWAADDTAKVTVVFWGENADDEEYSYIKSSQINVKPGTEFTYRENGALICALQVHSHDASCGYACEQEEHQHDSECYTLACTQEKHSHSESCYTCHIESHTHAMGCYVGVGEQFNESLNEHRVTGEQKNGAIGQSQYFLFGWNDTGKKYIYINGTWYKYTGTTNIGEIAPATCGKTEVTHTHTEDCLGCGKTEHTHTDYTGACYTLTCTTSEHTHSDACGYNCGKTEHTHISDCYMSGAGLDSNLWTLVKSDTVTVAADGSSVVNVYYDRTEKTLTFKYDYRNKKYNSTETITAKWGSNISEQYRKIASNAGSTFWSAKTDGSGPYTNYFGIMPQTSATYYNRGSSGSTGTMTYWGQDLNGEYTVKLFEVTGVGGYTVTDEDRYEFAGFTYHHGTSNGSKCEGAAFYYTRNSYTLTFNDGYNDVKKENVMYEASLSTYSSYIPNVPAAYEPGSVTFGGWYLNPECTGQEYILNNHTMPADNILLYAKWVPVQHTVEFYLNKDAMEAGTKLATHEDVTVPHGSKVTPVPVAPENGSYTFVGWFYMENGQEKAFDFENMPVNKNLQVYGKWNSNVLKQYTIYYKIQGTDTEIADPTTGSTLAGTTKTFDAKGGSDLYADYQEGYFPVAKSHSMTIDIEATAENDTNVYTFRYVQKEAVPYTVKYLNKETGEPVTTEKTVSDNRKAVVTETFVPVSGMLPDAYQKRLVVSGEEGAVNEIIFYYTEDTTHAYYKITHYTENLATDAQGNTTWTEYASSQAVGDIGTTYNADPMTIAGFTYNSTVEGTVASGELTANGLELKLYYNRNSYPYQVRYLEQGTGKELNAPKNETGKYGEVISESAIDIPNYTAVAPTSQTLSIKIEDGATAERNIITFYYTENTATINYQVVGPDGCGTVSPASETVKVLSGAPSGSTPTASENYIFKGWYSDYECTTPVDAAQVDSNNTFTPIKLNSQSWTNATYYAKFEYALADLTIAKTGIEAADDDMTIVFNITGEPNTNTANYKMTVTVDKASGWKAVINNLPVGKYTVTEDTNWSWRYTPDSTSKEITLIVKTDNTVTFENSKSNDHWLDSNTSVDNVFTKTQGSGN